MNWRFVLPFAIVAVAVLAVLGVATLRMSSDEVEKVAVAPIINENPVTPPTAMVATSVPAMVSTGDPIADIVTTIDAENSGDSTVLSDTSADATLVANDSAELSGLTTTYDATTF